MNERIKTPSLHKCVHFPRPKNASGLKSIIRFKNNYLIGKLYLFLKTIRYFRGSRFLHVLYYQQLSAAQYQGIVYANNFFE